MRERSWRRTMHAVTVVAAISCGAAVDAVAAEPPNGCIGDPLTSDRVALVIGVSDYGPDAAISGVQDARDFGCALQELGFTVVGPVVDPDMATIKEKLQAFGDLLVKNKPKVALVYFSGHGVEVNGEDYLVPKNADFSVTGLLTLSMVLDKLALAGAADRIVVLDACRSETIRIKGLPDAHSGFVELESNALKNTLLALAASFGQSAASGPPDGNSPYTRALLSHLLEPGFSLREILAKVTKDVSSAHGSFQLPTSEGGDSFAGSLYLRPAVKVTAKIANADDDLQILLPGQAAITLRNRPVNVDAAFYLRAGTNQIEVKVFNDRTYRNFHTWESAEGWSYNMHFEDAAGQTLGATTIFKDGEDVVYKDGPHHGQWFTVARLNLVVSSTAPTATVEMRVADGQVARKEGLPTYAINQALLCKITVVPALPLLRPNLETLFLVGGEKDLRAKARGCFSQPGMKEKILVAAGKKAAAKKPDAMAQAISAVSQGCAADHLWYALEDHKVGELQDVPTCN